MLLRESLADALFLVAPALLKLADALGGQGYTPCEDNNPRKGPPGRLESSGVYACPVLGSALSRRKDVGARITRDICRLLETGGCADTSLRLQSERRRTPSTCEMRVIQL